MGCGSASLVRMPQSGWAWHSTQSLGTRLYAHQAEEGVFLVFILCFVVQLIPQTSFTAANFRIMLTY